MNKKSSKNIWKKPDHCTAKKKGISLMNINLRQNLIQIIYFKVEIKMYEKVTTLSQTDFDYFTKITVKSC